MSAEAVVHVQAGRVEENIEKTIQLKDHGNVTVDLKLAVEKHDLVFRVPVNKQTITVTDSAVVFRPRLSCTKASFNFAPSDNITTSFATISPIKLRIVQGLGSETIKPSVLIDNLPIILEGPHGKDKSGNPVSRLPDRAVFAFKHPYIQMMFCRKRQSLRAAALIYDRLCLSQHAIFHKPTSRKRHALLSHLLLPISCQSNHATRLSSCLLLLVGSRYLILREF